MTQSNQARVDAGAPSEAPTCEGMDLVCHELRNPATAMIMTAETLAEGRLGDMSDAQKQALRRIMAAGRYLVDLIDGYLGAARGDDGDWPVRPRMVSDFMGEVICPAIETTAPAVAAAGMRLIQHTHAEMGPIQCDPDLLRIVVANLLANAAKFGRADGQIRLSVYRLPRRVEVAVYNEGQGFDPEREKELFDKFARIDPAVGGDGFGVGLYSCRRIVQAHGGSIVAAGQRGQWAEFSVSLPQPMPDGGGATA